MCDTRIYLCSVRIAAVSYLLLVVSSSAFAQDAVPPEASNPPLPVIEVPSDSDELPTPADASPVPELTPQEGSDLPAQPAEEKQANKLAPRTFAQADGAPVPTDATRLAVPPDEPSALLWVPRVLLLPFRGAFYLVNLPIRSGMKFYEKYNVGERVQGAFFNDERTIGLYPTALFATGFGLNIGARFIHRDVLQRGIEFKMQAGFGGQFKQIYGASLNLNRVMPKQWKLGLQSTYERRPKDLFLGFGNNDTIDGPVMAADPFATSADARFRQDLVSTWMIANYSPKSRFSVTTMVGHTMREFADDGDFADEESITSVYDSTQISGFDSGTNHLTGDVSVQFDSRRGYSQWDPHKIPSRGFLMSAFGSLNQGVGRSDDTFARIGGEAQSFIRLAQGPRILAARFMTESTVALRGTVPFVEVPRLGGGRLLRGYNQDQFRDKASALATVEYSFDAGRILRIALFSDAGRTFPEIAEFSLEDLRIGYGAEVRVVAGEQVGGRISLASSIDGGLFFVFSTASAFDFDSRYARK